MTPNLFDRIEADLGRLARDGAHLERGAQRRRRQIQLGLRHGTASVALAVAVAASLAGWFPDSAGGHVVLAPAAVVRAL